MQVTDVVGLLNRLLLLDKTVSLWLRMGMIGWFANFLNQQTVYKELFALHWTRPPLMIFDQNHSSDKGMHALESS